MSTIVELLALKKNGIPPIMIVGATFKKAKKFIKEQDEQHALESDEK